jgi:hypothetical protein
MNNLNKKPVISPLQPLTYSMNINVNKKSKQVVLQLEELVKNFPYPHGRVSLRQSDLKYLFTHPKGLPYREVWHFYKKFGGFEIYFYIIFRYLKIISKVFSIRNFKNY